jgi:hypothetical protein
VRTTSGGGRHRQLASARGHCCAATASRPTARDPSSPSWSPTTRPLDFAHALACHSETFRIIPGKDREVNQRYVVSWLVVAVAVPAPASRLMCPSQFPRSGAREPGAREPKSQGAQERGGAQSQ